MHVINQAFTGLWIPREVALDKDLNPLAKVLYAVIQALDTKGCYASNAYLCEIVGCNKRHIQGLINILIERGLVVRSETGFGNAKTRLLTTATTLALQAKTPCTPVHPNRKEDKKEDRDTPLPPWGEGMAKAWNEWVQFRKEKKAKLTATTVTKQFEMLASLSSEDEAIECVQQSIRNGWQGLFPPRQVMMPKRPALKSEDHSRGF
jgi:hypothetical protein